MPQYICLNPIKNKYEKDEIIPGRKFRKLLPSEQLYFKVYVPVPEKSFAEQLADNIQAEDKEDR